LSENSKLSLLRILCCRKTRPSVTTWRGSKTGKRAIGAGFREAKPVTSMRTLNKVTLIGNLGAAPDFQQLDGNIPVAKCSLATTEIFKDRNGQTQSQTDWHTVVLWRSLAELAHKYLQKGSLVYVEGKLKTRHYDDMEGNRRYVTEVVAEQLIMLDKKTGSQDDD
jgi:single-strand DNA-binding protein